MINYEISKIVELIDGTLTQPTNLSIGGAATIASATENDITFVTSPKHLEAFEACSAPVAIVPHGIETATKPCIQVDDSEAAFTKIVQLFRPAINRTKIGISPQAIVSPTAKISDDVCIHPGAVIMDNAEIGCGSVVFPNVTVMENCKIGANCQIFPGATLYENTEVGDRCIIHAGAVLGAFGFGYKSSKQGHELSSQLGNVRIESDVEIGANSTIDRGTFDTTTIGAGSKLDDMVMIGHNCQIGKHNLLCSQVGIAGSCTTGDFVVMGGQVGLADHLDIGENALLAAKSGLMNNVEPGAKMFGIPARPIREEMQLQASRAKLPEMRKSFRRLEKQVAELEKQIDQAKQASPAVDLKDAA